MTNERRKVIDWIERKGYSFKEGEEDLFDPTEKVITIKKKLSEQNKLFTLLHECGHFIVQKNPIEYRRRYKVQHSVNSGQKKKSTRWRIEYLKEEYEAWDKGFGLSKSLTLNINEDKYFNYASKCLKSYCQWVCEPKSREI